MGKLQLPQNTLDILNVSLMLLQAIQFGQNSDLSLMFLLEVLLKFINSLPQSINFGKSDYHNGQKLINASFFVKESN